MGCSISKELESPIKTSKEAWDAMLSQGLAVQKNSSLKSSDKGYIAAIFSANYGTLRMDGSVKSVDSKVLTKPSGNYQQHKVRKEGGGDRSGDEPAVAEKLRKSRPDSLPKLSSESEATAAAKRATEDSTVGEPETINTWELMQGLDDDDGSPTVGGAESSNSAVFSEDPAAMAGETVRPRREDSIAMPTERSSWIPEHLQRALSFKYIFNSSSLNQDAPAPDGSFASQSTKDSSSDAVPLAARSMEGDGPSSPSSPEFSAAASLKDWLPESCASKQTDDSQACSSIPGPPPPQQIELAAPYLPNSKRLRSTINKYGCGSDDQVPAIVSEDTTEPNKSSSSITEKSGKSVFDPEKSVFDADLLDSFEKAMEQLSQEEWYAVRNMEVGSASPKEFLHVVNSSRGNSQGGAKTTKKAPTNVATMAVKGSKMVEADPRPWNNSSHNQQQFITEGRKSPIRQNSGEVKEAKGMDESVVVLYSTSWQGNAKVFEDCNAVRMILRSVGASFDERNIHEHPEYEQQLKQSNNTATIVPTLWVKGRCMAGADSILQLYKKGILGALLREALPGGGDVAARNKAPCICRGGKFLICPLCKGRGKLVRLGEIPSSCRHCSGTGLIKCPNCSSS